jgi:D-arabinose 1-dehydrogenase-like Zn-dependent alcohol dehydrogenase
MGFRTVAIGRGREKEKLAKDLGAHVYIDTAVDDAAAVLQRMGGARAILATATSGDAMRSLVSGLSARGKLIVVGLPRDVRAAKDAGVKHFVWSTLPNVEAISGGKFYVPHFIGKAKIDRLVKEAGFAHHTLAIAPLYYQMPARSSCAASCNTKPSGKAVCLSR